MRPISRDCRFLAGAALLLLAVAVPAASAAENDIPLPAAAELQQLLEREPISLDSWNSWRKRLRSWLSDRTDTADPAYDSARKFLLSQTTVEGDLQGKLATDHLAWYLLGGAYLRLPEEEKPPAASLELAHRALDKSISLFSSLPQAHAALAYVYMQEALLAQPSGRPINNGAPLDERWTKFEAEISEAKRLDPSIPVAGIEGQYALYREKYADAESNFRKALIQRPSREEFARGAALAILQGPQHHGNSARAMQDLLDRFPQDGFLVAAHGLALARDDKPRQAVAEFARARQMGTDPEQVFSPQIVALVENEARPGPVLIGAVIFGAFAVAYAAVMAAMALAGFVLARRTRGIRALDLLGPAPTSVAAGGQVYRSQEESSLARAYTAALMAGLVVFYVSLPFLTVGLLGLTGGLIYVIFSAGRIPIKLVLLLGVAGIGGAYSIVKSLFAKTNRGTFGIAKTAADCPQLYAALAEVAQKVDTQPVDQVYLAHGSSIGVYQEGRGPFGLLGVKRRVLTLGLSTMHYLNVSELKSILAHEYAHFSHSDTFYHRFIYQVTVSIQEALTGMAASGGYLTYLNPVFWLMLWYYKCYNLLAAGFSRSREFLADRMAATLYGSDVFTTALRKVATEGTLFDNTMYGTVAKLLAEDKAFVNMYEAFRGYRDSEEGTTARNEQLAKLDEEKGSLFASHPTFNERVEAVAPLPRGHQVDERSSLSLFEDPAALEQELTQFLTGAIVQMQQAQAAAAAAAS